MARRPLRKNARGKSRRGKSSMARRKELSRRVSWNRGLLGLSRGRKRRGSNGRSSAPKRVRIDAPANTVARSFYGTKVHKYAKGMMKRYREAERNITRKTFANQVIVTGAAQAVLEYTFYNASDLVTQATAIGQGTGASGTLANTNQVFYMNQSIDLSITNSSNGNVELDIYHYSCRRDGADNVTAQWNQGVKDENNATTLTASTTYGCRPGDSNAVGDFWKIKKVTTIMLGPGQSHQHFIKLNLNRKIGNDLLSGLYNNNNIYLAGMTTSLLFVAKGMAISAAAGGGALTTANSAIDVVGSSRAEFKYILDNDTNFIYTPSGTLVTTAGNVYNQGSGAPTTSVAI